MNQEHSFGPLLRDTILTGKDTPTPLRMEFEELLYQRTGIRACHSHYAGFHLSIEADGDSFTSLQCHPDCEDIHGKLYPQANLRQSIFDCLNCAAVVCGLAPVDFHDNSSIVISDYLSTARNIYFSLHIVDVDRNTRIRFPNGGFMLRWRHANDLFYYIIYEDESVKAEADKTDLTAEIINYVNIHIHANDPLHLFDNELMYPVVTSKPALKAQGTVMGIMRNNTEFPSW